MNRTMQQPPSDDPKKARKPAIRPRHHVPGGPAGSPQHALTRLDEAERLERALLHELAGLLDGSTRFLRLAQRELRNSPSSSVAAAAAINHLAAAESALTTMAGMVQQTREVANDRPHPRYMVAPQPVHVAIDAAVAHTQHLAAEHGVRVAINLDASALSAPPLPIYPVIANALRNAIDAHRETSASDPNPEISVDAWCDELEALHICVRDNGVGLSDELRSDPSLAFSLGYTERRGGSGVGLALSADIVAALGGTIRLDAQASGGAKLSITIPIGTKQDPREQTDG
jgi:signal transduction histidine kinase